MTHGTIDGTVEKIEGGYALRYERYLRHPVEKVWAAITESDRLIDWLGAVEVDLVEGGAFVIRWLNTDAEGNTAIARGTITRLDPPHLLEVDTDIHGLLTWQLKADGAGCTLIFSTRSPIPDEYLTKVLAGWHIHIDFLEDALDGRPVDWPNWPLNRWTAHHERYAARLG
jgi:uncharacterized protein YndB with AHSA1/START domain